MARGTRKQTLIGDMADPIEFPHALATYVDVEMRAGRVPDVPLSALKEACELRTPDTAAVIESFRALFSSREASPRLRGARAPTLVDAFSCECAPSTGHVLRWSSHGGVATPSSPVRMLREALSDSKMPELPMNPFRFDPAAYPAADQSVFVVSSDSFPDTESWHAFCEANVKADLALATLNQIAAQFLRSLGEADAAKPAAPASATAAAITAAPAGASASSTTTPSEPAQPPSAGHFEGMPLINPGAALAACVRGIPGADAGVLEACPLTADEERELTQLCESVAKAALGRQPPHPLPPHVVASQCDEALGALRRAIVRFQSQQMYRWLARREELQAAVRPWFGQRALALFLLQAFARRHAEQQGEWADHEDHEDDSSGVANDGVREAVSGTPWASKVKKEKKPKKKAVGPHFIFRTPTPTDSSDGTTSEGAAPAPEAHAHVDAIAKAIASSSLGRRSSTSTSSELLEIASYLTEDTCNDTVSSIASSVSAPAAATPMVVGPTAFVSATAPAPSPTPCVFSNEPRATSAHALRAEAGVRCGALQADRQRHAVTGHHEGGLAPPRCKHSSSPACVPPSTQQSFCSTATTKSRVADERRVERKPVEISAAALRAQMHANSGAQTYAAPVAAPQPEAPPPLARGDWPRVPASARASGPAALDDSPRYTGTRPPQPTRSGSKGAPAAPSQNSVKILEARPPKQLPKQQQATGAQCSSAAMAAMSRVKGGAGPSVERTAEPSKTRGRTAAPSGSTSQGAAGAPVESASPPSATQTAFELRMARVRWQIEYYFSEQNLVRDQYLRCLMDEGGWVPLALLATFPKVASEGLAPTDMVETLKDSSIVAVSAVVTPGDEVVAGQVLVRKAVGWETWPLSGAVFIQPDGSSSPTETATVT